MNEILKQKSIRVFRFCASAKGFSFMLLWLMFLLFLGTFSQKYIGLYQAHQLYFDSYVLWLGGMFPLPGTRSILLMMGIGLLCKLLLEQWTMKKIGSLILHIGALLMLFGGFLSGIFASEGNVVLGEGQQASYRSDYYDVELAITLGDDDIARFSQDALCSGCTLSSDALPFSFKVEDFYKNIVLTQRDTLKEIAEDGQAIYGMRKALHLTGRPSFKEEEANVSGIRFSVRPARPVQGNDMLQAPYGAYSLIEDAPIQQRLSVEGRDYVLALRHKRMALPFSLQLIDFRKVSYPGTSKARSYESDIILIDGDVRWRSTIRMNEPLRYKGYTFFQSSFLTDAQGGEQSVLAAVHNVGRLFPYISTIMMCFGLIIHLFTRLGTLTPVTKGEK